MEFPSFVLSITANCLFPIPKAALMEFVGFNWFFQRIKIDYIQFIFRHV